jgi:hypothetical protein
VHTRATWSCVVLSVCTSPLVTVVHTAVCVCRVRPQRHCTAAINLIALLSTGTTPNDTRNHVDLVVQFGGIEACVSAMRAYQSGVCSLAAVRFGLYCVRRLTASLVYGVVVRHRDDVRRQRCADEDRRCAPRRHGRRHARCQSVSALHRSSCALPAIRLLSRSCIVCVVVSVGMAESVCAVSQTNGPRPDDLLGDATARGRRRTAQHAAGV